MSTHDGDSQYEGESSDAFSNTAAMSEQLDHQDDKSSFGDLLEQNDEVFRSRPNTSGRIPSKLSQVRLTPISRGHLDSSDDEQGEGRRGEGRGDRGLVEAKRLLITEVQPSTPGTPLSAPLTSRRKKRFATKSAPSVTPAHAEDEAEWDTDLEDEEVCKIDRDTTGRTAYLRACERLGVVPVSYFLRHIVDQELTMRYHGLGPVGTRAIAKVLKDNVTVEKLDLSGNWMEPAGAMYMSKLLHENDYITDLNLSDNKFQSVGAYHTSKMLQVNNCLKSLDLTGNEFGDDGAEYMAEALEKNKYLRTLNLSHNRFGDKAGCILGPAISSNDVLYNLDLSWNQLRRHGAMVVARGIRDNIRLKTCNLSWNGLGPEGGAMIADAVAMNQCLEELDISGNRLDLNTAAILAKALRKNEDLKVLKLGNNPITTSGAIQIARTLKEHSGSGIVHLDLTDIPVEFEFIRLVEDIESQRQQFSVTHGPVMRSGNTVADIGKMGVNPYPSIPDPLVVLQEHILVNDLRIIDILQQHDVDKTLSVTHQQFADSLEQLGVPYTKQHLNNIVKALDNNSDGKIYYGGFLQKLPTADNKKVEFTKEIET